MSRDEYLCPVCIERGLRSTVNLLQINSTCASYFCENLTCMFPGTSRGRFPVLKRSPDDMPVPLQLIKQLGLPESLGEESTLKVRHLSLLTELNALLPYAEHIFTVEDKWKHLMETTNKDNLNAEDRFRGLENLPDPDFKLLKDIVPKIKQFIKHFKVEPSLAKRLLEIS